MEIESIKSEKFNVKEQLERLKQLGGTMLACGTCIKSRSMQFEVCPISTMKDMLRLVVQGADLLMATTESRRSSTAFVLSLASGVIIMFGNILHF